MSRGRTAAPPTPAAFQRSSGAAPAPFETHRLQPSLQGEDPPAVSSTSNPRWWWSVISSSSGRGDSVHGRDGSTGRTTSAAVAWPHGKLRPAAPGLAESLEPLSAACGADSTALTRAVACLPSHLRQGVLAHGAAVAACLLGLGCERPQLARLVRRCLLLFSWPPEQRAGPLVEQLMAIGLTAREAVQCMESSPSSVGSSSWAASLTALAGLLAAGSGPGAPPSHQLAADLLRQQPGAGALLALSPRTLQRRAVGLGELGLAPEQLAAALHTDPLLLTTETQELAELAEVLQQELGGGGDLLAAVLCRTPSLAVDCCVYELEQRAWKLASVSAH